MITAECLLILILFCFAFTKWYRCKNSQAHIFLYIFFCLNSII